MYKDIRVKHEGAFTRCTDVVLVSGDFNAYRIIYTLPEGEQASVFKVTCTRADGKTVTDTGQISGRQCIYVIANSMYAIEGELTLRLSVSDGSGAVLTVCELSARAVGAGGDTSAAENLTPVLDKVLSRQSAAENEINSLSGSFNEFKANTASAENHRNILRCKNLGTEVTDAQKEAIRNGTFDDLFLGDYWVINGVNWRIADFDYWYNTQNTDGTYFTSHHLVIMPDTYLYGTKINDDININGGYVGTKLYSEGLNQAKTIVSDAFGDMVLTHAEWLINAVTDGKPSGTVLVDSTVEIPSEVMIYGTSFYPPAIAERYCRYTYSRSQLALFSIAPRFAAIGEYWLLRDIVDSIAISDVNNDGAVGYTYGNNYNNVRPVFCIG